MRPLKAKALPLLLVGFLLAGCTDLSLTNPNVPTVNSFWEAKEDALNGLNAVYNSLQMTGTYNRWPYFAMSMRSDLGICRSPWGGLSNFCKTVFANYDFEANIVLWDDHYHGIYRANQVITKVPDIKINEHLKKRIIGEARFIRALLYSNLVVLYGGNIPLILEPLGRKARPSSSTLEKVWAQIEKDLNYARRVLPVEYGPDDYGRATKGAATALLGRAHMMQREWSKAAAAFEQVIHSPANYSLIDDYADNFDAKNEVDNPETVFSVRFTGNDRLSMGVEGSDRPRMIGPQGASFADGEPTRWFFEQFFKEKTTGGKIDPRLSVTIFWNRPGGMLVFGVPYDERYGEDSNLLYWKKYTDYWKSKQTWDSPIDYKVIRFAGVLLSYAEALNEMGRTAEAYAPINRVRARVNLPPLEPGMSQAEMRKQIAHERILELGGENKRFLYLKRHNLLSPKLVAHDPEFKYFEEGRSELLPIPTSEVNLNPNIQQNPGY